MFPINPACIQACRLTASDIRAQGIPDHQNPARIFFRNSINNGLLLIEQPELHEHVKEGDEVTVVMNQHVDHQGKQYPIASLPENLMDILRAGGLVKAMRKLNGLD